MPSYTNNYELVKPTELEHYDLSVTNGNADKIDEVLHNLEISSGPIILSTGWGPQQRSRETSILISRIPPIRMASQQRKLVRFPRPIKVPAEE